MKTEVYTLPAHWASALVNDDFTGLEDQDEKELREWYAREQPGSCAGIYDKETDTPYFSMWNDAHTLACDVLQFEFYKPGIMDQGPEEK